VEASVLLLLLNQHLSEAVVAAVTCQVWVLCGRVCEDTVQHAAAVCNSQDRFGICSCGTATRGCCVSLCSTHAVPLELLALAPVTG
jgi:hypothetical protein